MPREDYPLSLPTYEVTGFGLEEAQIKMIARGLGIPLEGVAAPHRPISFVDTAAYISVPMVPVSRSEVVEERRRLTKNFYPEKPIEVKAIDYGALSKISALDANKALGLVSDAFDSTGLVPLEAERVPGHTVFKTVSINRDKGAPPSTTTNLDTQVSYRFNIDGHRLVGPGAQLQVSIGPDVKVTRLVHSVPSLRRGATVQTIPVDEVSARYTRMLPMDAEVEVKLVYFAPALAPKMGSGEGPKTILPYYAVKIKRRVLDAKTQREQTRTSRVKLIPATDDSRYVPSVTLDASAPERSMVEAHASVSGGTAPYTFLWAGSNPDASAHTGDSVSYVPIRRDIRTELPAGPMERTESVSVTLIDANGVRVVAGRTVPVVARPAPGTRSSITYGCESPNDPGPSPTDGSYAAERIAWQQSMGRAGAGGGSERFCWLADGSWPGDYIDPNPAGSRQPQPWINGDADYSNWGINTTNIMLYNGDGGPTGFAEMYPGATLADYNQAGGTGLSNPGNASGTVYIAGTNYSVNYNGSWGDPSPDDNLQWLAMYACQILENDSNSSKPWQYWGPAFNGLHSLLGFETEASDAGVGFMTDFPINLLGYTLLGFTFIQPETVVQAWINSAIGNDMGTPAAMGPIYDVYLGDEVAGVNDYWEYYWGKGNGTGPTIPRSNIDGWWYVQGTDAVQDYP